MPATSQRSSDMTTANDALIQLGVVLVSIEGSEASSHGLNLENSLSAGKSYRKT